MVIFKGILAVSAEQKTFGIPYQTLPWKRKQLRIPFRGTKIEAKRSKLSELPSELFHGRENNSEFLLWVKNRSKLSEFPSETLFS
jgi:hypothetical protein